MAFYLLIDYDNLLYEDKSKGLLYVIEKILKQFSPREIDNKNVLVRLYGGWYERNQATALSQNLNVEINADFPGVISLSDNQTNVIVGVELALSLTVEPTKLLFNTFRKRGIPSGLRANDPRVLGCIKPQCPVIHVFDFIRHNRCSSCSNIIPEDILYRQEQKLVDTMLTSDLISIANNEKTVCIVSSDDDFWPGILTAIQSGASVFHVHTKLNRYTPLHYSRTTPRNYNQKNI